MWRMLISDVLNVVQKQRVIEYKSGAGTKHKIKTVNKRDICM